MSKKIFYSFIFLLFTIFMVACGGGLDAPKELEINQEKLLFSEVEGAQSYELHVTGPSLNLNFEVKSGDSIYKFITYEGDYDFQVRAIGEDASVGKWSKKVTFNNLQAKLAAPENVKIVGSRISWDVVDNASYYDVIFVDQQGSETIKQLNPNSNLSTQKLVCGAYDVYVVAKSNVGIAESERSAKVTYNAELQTLQIPTGFAINEGYIYFDISGQTSKYQLKFENDSASFTRDVEGGMVEVAELLIPAGTYDVSIKACGDGIYTKDSEFSTPISLQSEVSYMTLSEKDLVNAGYVKWMGRTYYNAQTGMNEVYHSASGFEVFFKGSMVLATIEATNYSNANMRPYLVIVIDDDFENAQTISLAQKTSTVTLVSSNKDLNEHKVALYKRSESIDSHIFVKEIKTDGIFIKKIEEKDLKIEMIAASSSTGYGNLGNPSSGKNTGNSDALQAFAFLTARALNADINIFSASGWGCNASPWVTPNTLNVPDSYKYVDFYSKTPWVPEKYIPDVVIVNLGTNDYSYIKAATGEEYDKRMAAFQTKYVNFLKELHGLYPNAQIVVLYGLMGESSIFNETEQIVANAKVFIPNIASIKILGDAKGYNSHPSVASHKEIAKTLTEFIKGLLKGDK